LGLNENVSENNNISKTSEEANFEISQNKQKKNEQKQQKRKQKKKEEEDEEDEEIDATTNADEMEEDVDITNENLGSTVISSNNVSDAMPIEKNKTQFDDFSTTDEQQTQSDLSSVGNVESTKQIDETAKQNKSELNQIENNNNKRKFVDSEVIESKKKKLVVILVVVSLLFYKIMFLKIVSQCQQQKIICHQPKKLKNLSVKAFKNQLKICYRFLTNTEGSKANCYCKKFQRDMD